MRKEPAILTINRNGGGCKITCSGETLSVDGFDMNSSYDWSNSRFIQGIRLDFKVFDKQGFDLLLCGNLLEKFNLEIESASTPLTEHFPFWIACNVIRPGIVFNIIDEAAVMAV